MLEVKGLYQLNDPLLVHNIYHVTEVILLISTKLFVCPKILKIMLVIMPIILKYLYTPIILKIMPA